MVDALSILSCASSVNSVVLLYLLPFVAIFFIVLGMATRIGFLGVFGSIIFMVFSWFLSPCATFFAYVVALFSFVLLIWFAIGSLGFTNDTFK